MYLLITITYLLLTISINGLPMFYGDDAQYNPCNLNSHIFFYPHRTDIHKYYQCDEFGNAYLRFCGYLVWDRVHMTCSWRFGVIRAPSQFAPILKTSRSFFITQSSSTIAVPSSLCKPNNPCGTHGKCLEPRRTALHSYRRFACVCSDNWFGPLCDKHIDDLTTPTTVKIAQIQNFPPTEKTTVAPILTTKDSKKISYDFKESNINEELDRPLLAIHSIIEENVEISPSTEESKPKDIEASSNVEELNVVTTEVTSKAEEPNPATVEVLPSAKELKLENIEAA
ncbi:unnamed protein product, partial [Rotaria sordida]